MIYIEAPDVYSGPYGEPTLFLAGGITGCPNWQAKAVYMLSDSQIVVFNPRHADFPIHDPSAAAGQVEWEFRHLRAARAVLFWFAAGPSVQPIALYELGAHAATGKPLAVGADPGYLRRADVLLQLSHIRPELVVQNSLEMVCADARRVLWEVLP